MAGTRRGSNVGNALSVNRNVSVFLLLLLRRILFSKQTFSNFLRRLSSAGNLESSIIFPLFKTEEQGPEMQCSCCSALCSEYYRSTTSPWAFRLIFPTRAFQMRVSGVHAGVWGVLTEKFHYSKLMGLYAAARDVAPLFLISI